MSLQDDYFDLEKSLEGEQRKAFLRIWEAFVDEENDNEKLRPIVSHMRHAISAIIEDLPFK